jgi:hypothetical protein
MNIAAQKRVNSPSQRDEDGFENESGGMKIDF